jgi:hypothetical protein
LSDLTGSRAIEHGYFTSNSGKTLQVLELDGASGCIQELPQIVEGVDDAACLKYAKVAAKAKKKHKPKQQRFCK